MHIYNHSSQGDATDFGDMSFQQLLAPHVHQILVELSQERVTGAQRDEIEFVTISSTGDTTDFGNLLAARTYVSVCGNQTRGGTRGFLWR